MGVGGLQGEDSDEDAETDEAALASAESWEPDPIDADPSRSARSRRMHDIISMLVGIYGSKELFITEYRCSFMPENTQHMSRLSLATPRTSDSGCSTCALHSLFGL